jgi:sugar phosphate isomerase/epimerase
MVQACSKAGIKNVRVGALSMPQEAKFDGFAFFEKSKGAYKELVAETKKAGVKPCLELHMGTFTPGPSATVHFLKDFSPNDVGILYDPSNMFYEGWETPKVALNIMGAYLAEVHVKNMKYVPDGEDPRGVKKYKPIPADLEDGLVNWADIIDNLKVHGYKGWLVEEGHTHDRGTYDRLKLAFDLLKKLAS